MSDLWQAQLEYSNALKKEYQQSIMRLVVAQSDQQVYGFKVENKARGNRQLPSLLIDDISAIYDQINSTSLGRRYSDRLHDPQAPCMVVFLDVDPKAPKKLKSSPLITEDTGDPIKGLNAKGVLLLQGRDKRRFRHPPVKMYGQTDFLLKEVQPQQISEAVRECTYGITRAHLADLRFSQAYWIQSTDRRWVSPEELDDLTPFYSSSAIDPYSNMPLR